MRKQPDQPFEQIFRYQGTLKENVGDELLAFGAPLEDPAHTHPGVRGGAGHA